MWNVETGQLHRRLVESTSGHYRDTGGGAFSSDGRTQRMITLALGEAAPFNSLCFSPTGRHLAVVIGNGTVAPLRLTRVEQ